MPKNFENKKILVTGASGFIGSWLTEALIGMQANVSVLINKGGPHGFGGISHLADDIKIFYGDITKPRTLQDALKGQETVFHLAALTQVLHSFDLQKEFFEVNKTGTLNMLEAARKSESLDSFVFASTDKVYGEPKYLPIDEKHPLSSKSPYDQSKLDADVLVSSYHENYDMPTSRVRWSNTIGGRDGNILRAVPDFVTSIIHGKPPTIRGDGTQVRDYMYVTDAVSGIISVALKKADGEVFNLGTERPTTVLQLANLVIGKMGMKGKTEPIILGKNNPREINRQWLSAKKAREELGWSPKVSLEEAVAKSVEWYKSHPEWYDVMMKVKNYWSSKLSKSTSK